MSKIPDEVLTAGRSSPAIDFKPSKKNGISPSVALFGILLAGGIGYLIGTSPSGVSPPVAVTEGALPPWPIFRVAIGLQDFFLGAGEAMSPPDVQVMNLATSYWTSVIAYTFSKLRIQDELAKGPKNCTDVASGIGGNEDMVCRLLYAASTPQIGLVSKTDDGKWMNTAVANLMVGDEPASMRHVLHMLNEETVQAWYSLPEAIKKGQSGFLTKFGGEFWSWHSKNAPQQLEQFTKAMSGLSTAASMAILQEYDFAGARMLCDIGGGNGMTLSKILSYYPELHGKVLDLPNVVDKSAAVFEQFNASARAEAIPGSFFEPFPSSMGQCDVYMMKFILHDWDDASCIAILKNVAQDMKPGAKVIIVDSTIGTSGRGMEFAKAGMDINMMASNPAGAKERTPDQFAALLSAAGLKFNQRLAMRGVLFSITEGLKP